MTILEALALADRLRPNELDTGIKLRWLSALDGQIWQELLASHADAPASCPRYDENTELQSTGLLIEPPYDELYPRYLVMRVDLAHGELDRYNNDALEFNRLWKSFAGWYCRTHRPKGAASLRF